MNEEWRPVVGHEGSYEVSDLGRVRSLDRVERYERVDQYSGRILRIARKHAGRLLRPGRQSSGHLSVDIGKIGSRLVHVLVLEAFIGPCPAGCESLHRDDVAWHNFLSNLHWGTRSQNILDAVSNGKVAIGEDHHSAKLKNTDIPLIRERFGKASYSEIARQFGVNEATIRQIKDGKCWKNF